MLSPSTLDSQLQKCHNMRGNLFVVSPTDPLSEMIAKYSMALFSVDTIFAGCQKTKFLKSADKKWKEPRKFPKPYIFIL